MTRRPQPGGIRSHYAYGSEADANSVIQTIGQTHALLAAQMSAVWTAGNQQQLQWGIHYLGENPAQAIHLIRETGSRLGVENLPARTPA